MSVRVVVKKASFELLRQHAMGQMSSGFKERADGMVVLDLDDDVADRLAQINPDPDQAIRAVCTRQFGRA